MSEQQPTASFDSSSSDWESIDERDDARARRVADQPSSAASTAASSATSSYPATSFANSSSRGLRESLMPGLGDRLVGDRLGERLGRSLGELADSYVEWTSTSPLRIDQSDSATPPGAAAGGATTSDATVASNASLWSPLALRSASLPSSLSLPVVSLPSLSLPSISLPFYLGRRPKQAPLSTDKAPESSASTAAAKGEGDGWRPWWRAYRGDEAESRQGQSGSSEAISDAALRQAFDAFDTDGSGTIDREEMSAMVTQLGLELELSPARIDRLMSEADPDESGEIDFEEFVSTLRSQLARADESAFSGSLAQVVGEASALLGVLNQGFELNPTGLIASAREAAAAARRKQMRKAARDRRQRRPSTATTLLPLANASVAPALDANGAKEAAATTTTTTREAAIAAGIVPPTNDEWQP